MKCPNCGYTHGWGWQEEGTVEYPDYIETIGEFGDFWESPIQLNNQGDHGQIIYSDVFGCPSCKVLFLEN